jgi:hypothetical protein
MRFPSLEVMIRYGIYTVKELERFAKGLTPKKKIKLLSECTKCDFVHEGNICLNCHPWNIVQWRVICPKDQKLSVTIICVLKDNLSDTSIESVWKRDINPTNLQTGYTGNMESWSFQDRIYTVMLYHFHVSCVGKPWKNLILGGKPMTVVGGCIVKKLNAYQYHCRQQNKREF